ncbi:MAG: proline--tRNA ligase [Dehalococcoidia bacterium]|nr:proline--tRNA ligase [Dehalococcoidia bacterium]
MRLSKLFGRTTRETPADAESISHQLLLKAGMISQGTAGVYSYLPLSWRVLRKIEQVVREEMDKAGGQELRLPALQPFELWETSGRCVSFGQSLFTLLDRKQHRLALGPTHEEVITDLARRFIQSYRDMPARPYQIQTKFRDEPRPRGGLLRVREFIMKDMYSFDTDFDSLDITYRTMAQAYANIYRRLGVPAVMVEADSGAIGGKDSHEFMALTPTGEDIVMHCPACAYAANMEKASSNKSVKESCFEADESAKTLEEVATPDSSTIEDVAAYLHLPTYKTLKAVFYMADGQFILAVIRGDLEVNDVKLQRALKCTDLRLAEAEEVQAAGIIAGFCSPIGVKGIRVVADDSATGAPNLVAGANRAGYHFINSNYGRDYVAETVADIALARENDPCPRCGGLLRADRGIEVGHIFKLGTHLSEMLSASFLDESGVSQLPVMGCYGIGLGRLLAAIIEYSHDDKGIIWPMSLAPYHVHICTINPDKDGVATMGESLYEQLQTAGVEVLYDDGVASPGVKFNDADLIGVPVRVTISPRTVAAKTVEVKLRTAKDSIFVPVDDAVVTLTRMVRDALAE